MAVSYSLTQNLQSVAQGFPDFNRKLRALLPNFGAATCHVKSQTFRLAGSQR